MGRLVDGEWVKTSIITSDDSGSYDRIPRSFLDEIGNDSQFKPEKDRYHLYVSYACPWAHRTLIYRELKDLQEYFPVSVVSPDMLEEGWSFDTSFKGATGDDNYGFTYLREIYQKAQDDVSTSVTVPVVWDKKNETIVNNESSQIIRFFNTAFNHLTGNNDDYYPENLRAEIDQWNDLIYDNVNNGVYKSGFARNQAAYEKAVTSLFQVLDQLENHLEGKDYLVGNQLTEADIRLFPTLIRFDAVYVTHFKCNMRRIKDYKNLSRYLKSLYAREAFQKTTNIDHIKRHYYYSHEELNPKRIVPLGPTDII